jgi:shikimate dehydrogenase
MARHTLDGHTRTVGIFGDPITHTRSPAMHNAAFQALGLPYVYLPFHVRPADLVKAVHGMRALGLLGLNVTVPHKERIVRCLDSLSPEAELCGAVNTVVNQDGQLFGDNTDGRGFLNSLQEAKLSPRGIEVVLIGAGGSARAVLVSLIRARCAAIRIVNRTQANARKLVRTYRRTGETRLEALPLDALRDPAVLSGVRLVINASSIGLHDDEFLPLAYTATQAGCLFYDLLYRPDRTPFLRHAQAARRPVMDGRRMLLHQGALAFSLWTGRPAPLEVMDRALRRALRQTA